MAQTPFELRAGLLVQARLILNDQYQADVEQWRYRNEEAVLHHKELPKCPDAPTVGHIIEVAKQLNDFMSNY